MEEEQLQPTPELTTEPIPEPVPDEILGQPEPVPEETNNDVESASPVNTGLPEPPPDSDNEFNYENVEEIPPQDEVSGADDQEQTDGEADTGEEEEGAGGTTNITIVRPPVQTYYNVQADTEAIYHTMIENGIDDPVPVLVTETLIEPVPGIMKKKLEDYTVTEGLLLLILITLWLRMIFDYLGRRKS